VKLGITDGVRGELYFLMMPSMTWFQFLNDPKVIEAL
jgi:hypothetical protein